MKNIFLTSSAYLVLDKIVPLLKKAPINLKVAFIPTAGDPYGPDQPWMKADRDKLSELGFQVFEFDLKNQKEKDITRVLNDTDIIFVGGGNTFYLLKKARACGFDRLINKLVDHGKVYIGSSAGSCIAGPDLEPITLLDDPEQAELESTRAFGLVDFVVLPHYGRDKYKDHHKKVLAQFQDKYKIVPLQDDQLLVVGNKNYEII